MEYLSVAEARNRRGLKLVLSIGVPGPWGESAKAVLNARHVAFLPVAQTPMAPNDELRAWTGMRNAPIAVLDDEPPVHSWFDILMLAETLGRGPSLLPHGSADRMQCLGIAAEICGRDGFGWNRRLSIMAMAMGVDLPTDAPPLQVELARCYDLNARSVAQATARTVDILETLTSILKLQSARGSRYLVGNSLSAADIYWATFSQMIAPLPQAVNPMPDYLIPLYSTVEDAVRAAMDPILFEHRDAIYRDHIGLPLDY